MGDGMDKRPDELKIVAIGGGHGLSAMLRGLKYYTKQITAIVTMADNGGSSGMLRQELGMLPPGDARNCVLALSNAEPELKQMMGYRFSDGSLAGQSLGNLMLAALNDIYGSFGTAVRRLESVLSVNGRVLPVTEEDIQLVATFSDGTEIIGESEIFYYKKETRKRIRHVRLVPDNPSPYPESLQAIREADLILIGPGSLYTSIIPNFLVEGITEAVRQSEAVKLMIMNLMTQDGETEGYTASDHIRALRIHSAYGVVDTCLASNVEIPQQLLEKYRAEGADALVLDEDAVRALDITLYTAPLMQTDGRYVRHDSARLAHGILETYEKEIQRRAQLQK